MTAVTFSAGEVTLEGVLRRTPAGRARAGVVLCHPHPLYGGNLQNPVIRAVADALAGVEVASLRFNFRGTGGSGGTHEDGVGEVADVRAALATLAGAVDGAPLAVCGYSFGAAVGLRPEASASAGARIAVAPPLTGWPMEYLREDAGPKFVVVGEGDDYCPPELRDPWFRSLPDPKGLEVLPGADHFLAGREGEVGAAVARFVDAWLRGLTGSGAPRGAPPPGA